MIPDWIKVWFWENWRKILAGTAAFLLLGYGLYFIRAELAQRQERIEAMRAVKVHEWRPDPETVADVFDTESPLLPPRIRVQTPLERELEPIEHPGPDVRKDEYKLPEYELQESPSLLGVSVQ